MKHKNQITIFAPIGAVKETPEALQIAVTIHALKGAGVNIRLVNFTDSPQDYSENIAVEEVLLRDGPDVFPLTIVDGEVFQKKEYPHYGELLAWSAGVPQVL
ncbi:arsenic metallochaperone ArsD family protein [Eubacterium barkeri]|uniref:Arsenical resistance operon trans-acting repressor ArsD n=1 Tax=Eubacterium barkeri TaxID=1528 RepID=A0A1H3BM35_EUBBA|nr:arsenic metallochaperone ArsD family protein [Eubacterium barkeri]SDX42758.1 Arsenical resistance operon trans-acting repressor ArsD [Eubacterium barkeri]